MAETPLPTASLIRHAASIELADADELVDKGLAPVPDLELGLEEHKLGYEVDSLKQQLLESQETHKLRLAYSRKLFWLVCSWLTCVIVAVGLSGFHLWGFSLTEAVLIAFITTTTINVLGLFFVVAKWLFPTKS